MVEGGAAESRELDQTPTWAVASVAAVIILISIMLEKVLHHIGEWFTQRRKKALFEALEKVKAELMILGFISLLLTFGQNYISKICISDKTADTMLPCRAIEAAEADAAEAEAETEAEAEAEAEEGGEHHRRLLWFVIRNMHSTRRFLSEGGGSSCPEGKVPLVSVDGIHQLHIFIFFLALFHVVHSCLTMALGRAKIRQWKEWEKETSSLDYEFSNDPSRFRFTHETSFVRMHTSAWNKTSFLFYVVSFFRQFFRSVRKADYLAMRHGFISAHLAPGSKFDFQKYIKRSLEDDFKVVVGISPTLWASSVLFLLLNVHGWQTLFWVSMAPLLIILAVGTKLQAIITQMALEIKERHVVIQGMPLVQLTDHHFWFGNPALVLFLIHLTLFQNAFQIIYFLWIWYEFGLKSCFHRNFVLTMARIYFWVAVQFLCSYVTLPLYALVSQMGSHMKRSIFDEQMSKALKKWHQAAKKKNEKPPSPSRSPGGSPHASPSASQPQPLRSQMGYGNATSPSRRRNLSDHAVPDSEKDLPSPSPSSSILMPSSNRSDVELVPTEGPMHTEGQRKPEDNFLFASSNPPTGPSLI